MKKVLKNPFVYISILLFVVLIFQIAQIVRGQTGTWQPPTAPPPGGEPAAPLDTVSDQTASGLLTLKKGLVVNQEIQVDTGSGRMGINFLGGSTICLPESPANERQTCKQYWNQISAGTGGAGGGGGDSLWTTTRGAIYYNGSVGIGAPSPDFVYGRLQINGTGYTEGLAVVNSSRLTGRVWVDKDGSFFISRGDDPARAIIIDDGGWIGIGTKPKNQYGKVQINISARGDEARGYAHGLTLWNGLNAPSMFRIWLDEYGGSKNDIVFTRGIKLGGGAESHDALKIDGEGNVFFGQNVSFGQSVQRLKLNPPQGASQPTCNEAERGLLWYEQAGAGLGGKDNLSICMAKQTCGYVADGERWRQIAEFRGSTYWEKGIDCKRAVGEIWNCEKWVRAERQTACPAGDYKWVKIAEY